MNCVFSNVEAVENLQASAARWMGTPFVSHANVQGSGVDCVHLILAIYAECGFPLDIPLPTYGLFDGACRTEAGPVLEALAQSDLFCLVWEEDKEWEPIRPGDLLCFRIGKSVHHLGVAVSNRLFIHSMTGYGVVRSCIDDTTYLKRLAAIYRPVFP